MRGCLARRCILAATVLAATAWPARSQDNYEIQVYGSDTIPARSLMVELHSNFAFEGSKAEVNGVRPSEHALHETLELTYGWNSWFETGFYVFTSARAGEDWQWVGDHIRPRVRAPESWGWPVGVSLSTEIGYQRRSYSEDTWNWEIRPIIDKQIGRLYLALNPALERSLRGRNVRRGWELSPNFKVSYEVSKVVAAGIEYYGSLGPLDGFDPSGEQQHQIVPSVDLNLDPDWEFNAGVALGLTHATDRLLVKVILGRRFSF
jgi:Putative MetA-pathway of phenol degradation